KPSFRDQTPAGRPDYNSGIPGYGPLYVGGASSGIITAVDIDPQTGAWTGSRRVALETCVPPVLPGPAPQDTQPRCNPIGVTRLPLSPLPTSQLLALPRRPDAAGPHPEGYQNLNTAGFFLYAVALDQTVRVLDADALTECEAQADPQLVAA